MTNIAPLMEQEVPREIRAALWEQVTLTPAESLLRHDSGPVLLRANLRLDVAAGIVGLNPDNPAVMEISAITCVRLLVSVRAGYTHRETRPASMHVYLKGDGAFVQKSDGEYWTYPVRVVDSNDVNGKVVEVTETVARPIGTMMHAYACHVGHSTTGQPCGSVCRDASGRGENDADTSRCLAADSPGADLVTGRGRSPGTEGTGRASIEPTSSLAGAYERRSGAIEVQPGFWVTRYFALQLDPFDKDLEPLIDHFSRYHYLAVDATQAHLLPAGNYHVFYERDTLIDRAGDSETWAAEFALRPGCERCVDPAHVATLQQWVDHYRRLVTTAHSKS